MKIVKLSLGSIDYSICLPNYDTDFIQKGIYERSKAYELSLLKVLALNLDKKSLFLDIGANIGNHSLYLVASTGCSAIAFEPNLNLVNAFKESIILNNFSKKIKVYNLGVGEESGTASFVKQIKDNLGAQRLEINPLKEDKESINIVPLDDIIFDENISLIKIDVEGMEMNVLRGAQNTLNQFRPLLSVEAQSYLEFIEIDNYLSNLNYVYCNTFNNTPTHLFIPCEKICNNPWRLYFSKHAKNFYP